MQPQALVYRYYELNAITQAVMQTPEASLRMVAPGAGFRGGTLYRPKKGEDQQKKRSSLQNELVFSPKVCDDQKEKGFCLPISGLSVSKKTKTNGVTPKW